MLRRYFFMAVTAIASLAFATPMVQAEFVTSNGTVQLKDGNASVVPNQPNPPLIHITKLSLAGGMLYTNQITGTSFALGSTVNTIGVLKVSTAQNGSNSPIELPDESEMVVIFALQGTIVASSNNIVTAEYTIGRAYALSDFTGNSKFFDITHPETWNFGNQFAEYALGAQQEIVNGNLAGIPAIVHPPAAPSPGAGAASATEAIVNQSGVNTLSMSSVQGRFVFLEDSTGLQNAGLGFVNPGLASGTTGDNFLRDVVTVPGTPTHYEGFAPFINQTILDSPHAPLSVADLAALNAIAADAGFVYFATGLGAGPETHYAQGSGGDFAANISGDAYIGYSVAPEPSSVLLASIGLGALGLFGRRRLRTNKR